MSETGKTRGKRGTGLRAVGPALEAFMTCVAALTVLAAVLSGAAGADAQAAGNGEPLRVFVDMPRFNADLLRSEIPFATFVPAPEEADVVVSVKPSEKEGRPCLALAFQGRGRFEGDRNTIEVPAGEPAAPEDKDRALTQALRLGLLRYAAKTPLAKHISVSFQEQVKPTSVVDPWRFWVFNLNASSFLDGQEQYKDGMYYGSFSANRVTPEQKIRMSVFANFQRQEFSFDGSTVTSKSHGYGYSGLFVFSLGRHWSAGAFVSVNSSTYQNLKLGGSLAPALEYDIFPYDESTKRQLRILYLFGLSSVRYIEETIFFKTAETRLSESLSFEYEIKRPWGTISAGLKGSHYLHDLKKYRLELNGEVSLRVWKGLSFEIGGSASRIHDQLFLPRGGASYEEVLLRQKQLQTSYDYFFSAGLNFSFGSLKSNVVNPRFGSGGRSISISF